MSAFFACIQMIRPVNALMTGCTVALGFWLSHNNLPVSSLVFLALAGVCAVGFGNTINDIMDIESDKTSHPNRVLPQHKISLHGAMIFAFLCASFSFTNAFIVSPLHGIAVLIPLGLLGLYALFFKGTPLIGNFLVSVLVAYPLLFGGLGAPQAHRLYIPVLLAFLLNVAREIIKDLEDEEGDKKAHVTTTAALDKNVLKGIIIALSALYLSLMFVPVMLKQFGIIYLAIGAFVAIPLHAWWLILAAQKKWLGNLSNISRCIKYEMLAGLLALALDQAGRHWAK